MSRPVLVRTPHYGQTSCNRVPTACQQGFCRAWLAEACVVTCIASCCFFEHFRLPHLSIPSLIHLGDFTGSDRVALDPAQLPAQSRPYTEPTPPRPWRGIFASLFAREAQCSPGAFALTSRIPATYMQDLYLGTFASLSACEAQCSSGAFAVSAVVVLRNTSALHFALLLLVLPNSALWLALAVCRAERTKAGACTTFTVFQSVDAVVCFCGLQRSPN